MADQLVVCGTILALLTTGLGFCGDWHWSADLFANFRPQYVLGFSLLAAVFLLRRRWKVAAAAIAGALINFGMMWPHAMAQSELAPINEDRPRTERIGDTRIRVVSFNLFYGNQDLASAERFLRECDADVIAFQEITPENAEMLRKLAPLYPGQFIRGRKRARGTAILTRLPVKSFRFEQSPGQERVGASVGELVAPNGQPFTILAIHSRTPTSGDGAASQEKYFDWLAGRVAALRQSGTSLVLAGDFNATPWSRGFKRFTAAAPPLLDTSRGILFGATWSVGLPQRLMIDHVFASPEWRLLNREVGPEAGSDHRPLIVDLARS